MFDQDPNKSYSVTLMNESEQENLKNEENTPIEDEHLSEEGRKDPKDPVQQLLNQLTKELEEKATIEEKLQLTIDFMEKSLSQNTTPHFRQFWEARRICLPLFKENIPSHQRTHYWQRYSELSKEARRLKDILDEQSAFAVEQIEIAIKSLEQEIAQSNEPQRGNPFGEQVMFPEPLNEKKSFYEELQQQLNILNAHAARINALRKELLKTEMRIRQKNKFFQRLSSAGDLVFPKRKELIKQISLQFSEDVTHFIASHFNREMKHASTFFALREEIKLFQSLAKALTLNTNAFTQTRLKLSECWDQIKVQEKEMKKERNQQRAVFKQHADEIQQMIQKHQESYTNGSLSVSEANKSIDHISNEMRRVELGREDVKELREKLNELRNQVHNKVRHEEESRHKQEQENERLRKEKYKNLKENVESLFQNQDSYTVERLITEREALSEQIQQSSFNKNEKQELERLLKPIKDLITDKKEKAILDLPEDDRQSLQQLRELLQQRKSRRQEIKNQMEIYRKAAGSSSLDFEKAMSYNTQMNEEKERLEKINQGIKDIEDKISEIQAKLK